MKDPLAKGIRWLKLRNARERAILGVIGGVLVSIVLPLAVLPRQLRDSQAQVTNSVPDVPNPINRCFCCYGGQLRTMIRSLFWPSSVTLRALQYWCTRYTPGSQ